MYAEVKNKEAARERVAFLEDKSLKLIKKIESMSFGDLVRAENQLHAWRKEINTLIKLWHL